MSGRREDIVAAATRIAAESGLAALSVRVVADRAGVGVGTLRHYFPTQKDLYDEVIGRVFDLQLDDLGISDQTVPAARRLADCMQQFLPAGNGDAPESEAWLALYASALGRERSDAGARLLAAFAERARTRVDGWLSALTIDEAQRARDVVLLLSLVNGLCLELITPGARTTVEEARAILDEVIARMVVPGKGPRSGSDAAVRGTRRRREPGPASSSAAPDAPAG